MIIKTPRPQYWRTVPLLAAMAVSAALAGCGEQEKAPTTNAAQTTVEWATVGGTEMAQRHSPLAQINKDTVTDLGLAWKFDDFIVRGRVHRGNQGTPLVVDGVMYFTGPWSVVYAVDAVSGKELWVYDPEVEGGWARKTCCDVNNKGAAIEGDTLFVGVVDGYLDAVDIKTGERKWRTDTLIDRTRSYSVTGAPALANGNVIISHGGSDMDIRGYISAYNQKTGALVWRFYTVPGDPAINGDETPDITLARETWGDQARWDLGLGGGAYDSIVYDPELDIVYAGTSNGVPHPTWLRDPVNEGDNLYLSSIVAIDNKTGRRVWHYQTTPGDSWDFGSTQNMIMATLNIEGKDRKVIMQAPKNGFYYVIDRATGELLSADKFTTVTWATHVDMATGKPVLDERLDFRDEATIIWPSVSGAHNWQPMAYSPVTGLTYIPALEAPMKYVAYSKVDYKPGSLNEGKGPPLMPPFADEGDDKLAGVNDFAPRMESVLKAWDPVAQKVVWQSKPQTWWSGGILSTEAGLIMQGAVDGIFRVYDAATGAVLKEINTGIAMLAPPMTYMIDGIQYVAVLGGLGGSESAYFPDESAAKKYENPETLFVFKLGGTDVTMPPAKTWPAEEPLPAMTTASAEVIARGEELFFENGNCARCHSYRGSEGSYPNLWNMAPATHENFKNILLGGAYSYAGMASFADLLSEEDAEAIHAFLIADAHALRTEGAVEGEVRFKEKAH
ncbi:PQQ-dependent dehydrogenase, methanol/ethanol family [Kordiimonas pumila]|uniref:PQQ-dependent dehydrogenase, methanol/ethanol family n=1 Tax=Kordiimonas pumila TaxID=2161677 RepID=A0ABV7D8A8_9PROT|nr:PQQ-dependent dehydrogenase, methanol/ethanol family [Kordiimonas pumila]